MIKITISEPVPSLNVTLSEHWAVKRKRKGVYERDILLALLEKYTLKERRAAMEKVPRAVRIHSKRARKLDIDNLFGGGKSLIDALRSCKLLVEDNEEWLLSLEYTQETGKPYSTTIIIE
jgi:hypothetical protein